MELLKAIGTIALVLWGLGFVLRLGGKLLKFLLIIGIIMMILGVIS